MSFRWAIAGLVLWLGLLAGCRDKCRDAPPAFELDVRLPAGVDGSKVGALSITVDVVGLHKAQDLPMSKGIQGGKTTVSVDVGPTGRGGFTAQVSVVARDAAGAVLAHGASSYPAS